MWVFTKNSFISCVQHRERPNDVLVRARRRKDLARLFPKRKDQILMDIGADYHYRLLVSKKELAKTLSDYIMQQLTYDNFKAAQDHDDEWMQFLYSVWTAGLDLQTR